MMNLENNSLFSDKFNVPKSIQSNYVGQIIETSTTIGGYQKCILECSSVVDGSDVSRKSKKLIFIKKSKNIAFEEGSKILFSCTFAPIKNIGYPGEFDGEFYWKNKGIKQIGFVSLENVQLLAISKSSFFSPTELRNKLTAILRSVLSGQELALANALILGERSLLTSETTQQFSNTGAMHILAVSGLHIGILLQLLMKIFQLFQKFITKNQATFISLGIVWIYALITGFSPSVVRSVIMFSFIFLGSIRGKENSELNILALSAFLILCWNPFFIYDVGFQLSYAAMLGIYLFYPFLKNVIVSRYKVVQLMIEGSMVGIAAQITTIPLTLYYFHQFPNYFILTNIALMAFSFVILLLGMLLFSFAWIPFLKIVVGFLLQKTMTVMLSIVSFISNLPYSIASGFSVSKVVVVLFYGLIILFFYSLFKKKIKLLYVSLSLLMALTIFLFQQRIYFNTLIYSYSHSDYPSFKIIKSRTTNYYLFPSWSWKTNKTKKIMKDFNVVYPGKSVLLPLEKLK